MGKDWYEGCINSQEWRLNHLYYIATKSNGVVRFKMNWAQEYLYHNLHTRNTILKVRQLGMSTFVAILMLDSCLFTPYFGAGIIDKGLDDAKEKLAKMKLAYECMQNAPDYCRVDHVEDEEDRRNIAMYSQLLTTSKHGVSATFLGEKAEFSNGSLVRIGTSLRGGTIHLLHVSEYASTAANNPGKAEEILSGGFETVPDDGIIIMESTHEGAKTGGNYAILKQAMENEGKRLNNQQFKFFFFTWWKHPEYKIDIDIPLSLTKAQEEYFENLEKRHGITLSDAQKRWWCAKATTLRHRMYTEYPSTPDEAFKSTLQGSIYGSYITELRERGLTAAQFEADDYRPLYVSWDIGMADNTSMWLIQPGGDGRFYALDYFSAHNLDLSPYIGVVKEWGEKYHNMPVSLLPHDMKQRDISTGLARYLTLQKAGLPYKLLPRTNSTDDSIQTVRTMLRHFVFHERCNQTVKVGDEEAMSGVESLENYRYAPLGANGVEHKEPLHDAASHGADAFRMFVEAYTLGFIGKEGVKGKQAPSSPRDRQKRRIAAGVPSYWR